MVEEKLKEIIISSLLHDIGKLAIRAGDYTPEPSDADIFLPKNKSGKYTHIHAYYSHNYISDYLKNSSAATLAYAHHIPIKNSEQFQKQGEQRIYVKIIKLADWLSSGERREKDDADSIGEIPVSKQPLKSIFSMVKVNGKKNGENFYYHPITCIQDNLEKLYPTIQNDKEFSFKNLWDGFKEDSDRQFNDNISIIYNNNFDKLIRKILSLLEKWTIFVPSAAYRDEPEVSLFHHLKTTSAIATCLYHLHNNRKLSEEKIDKVLSEIYNKNKGQGLDMSVAKDFILLSGDISGIQDFIYSVTTKHALKGLRGRSFYLQLLTDAVARYIADKCNVSTTNILFLAGGHFGILLPNLDSIKEKISNIKHDVNKEIYKFHKVKLGLTIGYTEFSYDDFSIDKFEKVIEDIHPVMAKQKKQKFNTLLDKEFFEPKDDGFTSESICNVCSDRISDVESIELPDEDNVTKCAMCKSFEDISGNIKTCEFLTVTRITDLCSQQMPKKWQSLLQYFGYNYDFKDRMDSNDTVNYTVYKINDVDLTKPYVDGFIFEPITENYDTLEEIADKSEGVKKYAALKIDVDNLSQIKPVNNTISRFSMFSYVMNLFFTIGIKYIVEQKYKENAIVVYSGGDDLFILGAWNSIPVLAQDINESFKKFVSNSDIHISAGIYIAHSKKFPVFYSAKQASVELDRAKEDGKNDKNRISFLSRVIKWDEIKTVQEVKDNILQLCAKEGKGQDGRSIIKILSEAATTIGNKKGINIIAVNRLLYAFKRYAERYEKDDKIQQLAMELRGNFITNYNLKENLDIAVQWADYLTRKEK